MEGWRRKCALTIDAAKIDAELTDWTFVVSERALPAEMFDADGSHHARDGGGDIRFSADAAGAKRLACDIRAFHIDSDPANGRAEIAVKVPAVRSCSDTTIYIWYDKPGAVQPPPSHPFGRHNAYDANYVAVWPDGGGADRTRHTNNGAGRGGVVAGGVKGPAGKATFFDGRDDRFDLPAVIVSHGNYSVEALAKHAAGAVIWAERSSADPHPVNQLYYGESGHMDLMAISRDAEGDRLRPAKAGAGNTNSWQHVAYTRSGTTGTLYRDGNVRDRASNAAVNAYAVDRATIGAYWWAPRKAYLGHFKGALDEIRISSTPRTASWIRAGRENLTNPAGFSRPGLPEGRAASVAAGGTGVKSRPGRRDS
jgi:hypothetical protein